MLPPGSDFMVEFRLVSAGTRAGPWRKEDGGFQALHCRDRGPLRRYVRRVTIRFWPSLAVIAGVLALPVLMGLGARWGAASEIIHWRSTAASLELENASYREATVQLSAQISTLQSAVDDIGERAAVDPDASRAMDRLPAAVESRAMGGSSATAPSHRSWAARSGERTPPSPS